MFRITLLAFLVVLDNSKFAHANRDVTRTIPLQTYYVSEFGDDRQDGLSSQSAFRTLERARAEERRIKGHAVILVSGTFRLTEAFNLTDEDSHSVWQVDAGKEAKFVTIGKVPFGIRVIGGSYIKIDGITFSGFSNSAIFISNSYHATVEHCLVLDTKSTKWSQASIHLLGSVTNSIIYNNKIIGSDYDGILVETTETSDITGIQIIGNALIDTCRRVRDCGAIHINDRSQRSSGILISENNIKNFGNKYTKGRGIYLDDWASRVRINGNTVEGYGSFAVHIHGGKDNIFYNNVFNLKFINIAILYSAYINYKGKSLVMERNYFKNNKFTGRPIDKFLFIDGSGLITPKFFNNKFDANFNDS